MVVSWHLVCVGWRHSDFYLIDTLFYLFYLGYCIHRTNTNMPYFAIGLVIYVTDLSKILH